MALQAALTSHRVLFLQSTAVVMFFLSFSSSFEGERKKLNRHYTSQVEKCCFLLFFVQLNSDATKH